MLNIIRLQEPVSLIAYRKQPNAQYDGPQFTPVKSDIRIQLLTSQGYICAYCMERIVDDQLKTKIEHWKCQDIYPQHQLDFTNMFAVCSGNTQNTLHCDSAKGNKVLTINPADSNKTVESYIKYTNAGEIYVKDDVTSDNDLNNILRLNSSRLKNNRKSVLSAITSRLDRSRKTATKTDLQNLLSQWSNVDADGKKMPYCGVAIYYLKKRLSKI